MANETKSYFFPPQWNYQLGGPIALGNIIADPKKPQICLNDEDPNRPPLPRLTVDHSKPDFKAKIVADTSVSAGIGTSLLQIFGFGVDLSAEHGKKRTYVIDARDILTQEIEPKDSFVEACFKDPATERYLRSKRFRREVYMITGVISATDATVSTGDETRKLFDGQVGVDFTAASGGAAPLGLHVKSGTKKENSSEASFGRSSFILGYRLRKISYLKNIRVKNQDDFREQAVLDDGDGPADGDNIVEEAVFEGLEEDFVDADEFDFDYASSQGNESDLTFIVPIEAE